MTNKSIANITILTALALFLLSLTQEAFCTHGCVGAATALLMGWMGMLLELGALASAVVEFVHGNGFSIRNPLGATFTWLANPVLFLSFIALKRNSGIAMKLSLVSTVVILCFLVFGRVVNDEAGHYVKVKSYRAGYWLCFLSSVTMLCGAYVLKTRVKSSPQNRN